MESNRYLDIAPEVKSALDAGRPVVALESTIISHGMPYPQNRDTALEVEKIIRDLGGAIRPSFRNTELEPAGESCLCIVFPDQAGYAIGSRPTVLGELEKYVGENYGKEMNFKARVKDTGERSGTIYVSEEEIRSAIHMDIELEEK